jgi:hypothetical protein
MGSTLDQIRELVRQGSVRISEHGYDELAADGIFARRAIEGISNADLVEDYPNYPKGVCVLVRETLNDGQYIQHTRRLGHTQRQDGTGSFDNRLSPRPRFVGK